MLSEGHIWGVFAQILAANISLNAFAGIARFCLGAVVGGVSGAAVQSLIVLATPHGRSRRLGLWVLVAPLAVILGVIAGALVITVMDAWLYGWRAPSPLIGLLVWGAIGSAAIGITEWIVLFSRQQRLASWMLICLIAGACGIAISLLVGGPTFWADRWVAAWAAGCAVWGLITGVGLLWLLPRTVPTPLGGSTE